MAATGTIARSRGPRRDRSGWLLTVPALLPVLALSVVPLVRGLTLAFTDARAGLGLPTHVTWFANFAQLAHDRLFLDSLRVGAVWAIGVTVLQLVLAVGLALLLQADLRLRWLARTLALVPWAMPPVIVAVTWRLLYDPTVGPVDAALSGLGVTSTPVNWLGEFGTALPAVVVVGVWVGLPQTTVVLLAGLQNVPRDLLEAAALDGAGAWRRFTGVTLPLLRPVVVAITSLNLIWNFNAFDLVYVLTAGGPGGKTELPMLFAYEEAFSYGQFGYAAAMGVVLVVIITLLLGLYLRVGLRSPDGAAT